MPNSQDSEVGIAITHLAVDEYVNVTSADSGTSNTWSDELVLTSLTCIRRFVDILEEQAALHR
jgi:hypothetical protein